MKLCYLLKGRVLRLEKLGTIILTVSPLFFKEGAECDGMNPIEQACCTNCRFSSNEIECRPATQCKESSKCPSDSAICPDQVNKRDGTPCKDRDGRESSCSNGKCKNRCDSLSDLDPVRFNYTNRLAICLCGVDQQEWMCARCCQSGKNKTTLVICINDKRVKS